MTLSLTIYAEQLEQLNARLRPRLSELSPAAQALLTQKGAITRQAMDELATLLNAARAELEAYEQLQHRCRRWLAEFLEPLHLQSENLTVHERVDAEDLRSVIREMRQVLGLPEMAPLPPPAPDA